MDVWSIKAEEAYSCLEPEIVAQGLEPGHQVTINTVHIGLSIARSLKRIADALNADGLSPDMHHSILNTAWEAGKNFQSGVNQTR
jgi:hypothetical protein